MKPVRIVIFAKAPVPGRVKTRLIPALGVSGTGSAWPDLLVAGLMALLALTASVSIVRQARVELASAPCAA